jgi:hypothetical protein
LKRFFKKAGAWFKDKFHKAKNVVVKFAKPVVRVVKKVTDFIGKTPIAPILNKVTGGVYGLVKKGIDLIPDGAVKDNVNKFADQAKKIADNTSSKIGDMQDKANQVIDKGKQWVDAGQRIRDYVKKQQPILKPLSGIRSVAKPAVMPNVKPIIP